MDAASVQKLFKALKNMIMSYTSHTMGDFADLKDVVEHFGRTADILAAFVGDSASFWTGNRPPLHRMLHKYRRRNTQEGHSRHS